ncbi:cysteine hydrolase [Leucobacter allii]|uniref:Cysteine hydrolase n=1 Tax=Leucobacter allii TaxID=2932247 RepID=A0ABY4FRC0_9MICO|nr:cysteine hydrolase family protein [Leucobacter allii]UOQ58807.1 cysteine hydrolase [Leucobacter allii]UOR00243.1 cysteine hydrolase [Leucobacter allii]
MTSSSALLVIDLQRGVLGDCLDADAVVARTARLVARARAERTPVIWVQDHGGFPEGSDDWSLAEPLARRREETLVRKAYRDSFADTELAEVLSAEGIRRLVVAGAQSDYCIRTTTQAAAARGFDVALVADAHTTTDAEFEGTVIPARQIIAHTNMYFRGLRYPGRSFGIAGHDTVEL